MTEHDGISPESEKQTSELDDVEDRDELRKRYDMLLQELRVTLPGVQVLTDRFFNQAGRRYRHSAGFGSRHLLLE